MEKKLGFGCLRLPLKSDRQEDIDIDKLKKMVDIYLENGFSYFEVAYNYHNFFCEKAIKECLIDRYKRDKYVLADKMPVQMIRNTIEYESIFEKQLENCGVSYFDYYLLHNINNEKYELTEKLGGFNFLIDLKAKNRVGKIGFSFHGNAELLEKILGKYAKYLDFVQLQINYLDWDSEEIQSSKCYSVARRYELPIFVMEPIKGGNLVNNLPNNVKKIFDNLGTGSYASYAIRWVASLEGVELVLSGMSSVGQVIENTKYMKNFCPITSKEKAVIEKACKLIRESYPIQCTQCRYCVPECPQNIPIPEIFGLYNSLQIVKEFRHHYVGYIYKNIIENKGTPDSCIKCGKCERVCSQHIKIRKNLQMISREFNGSCFDKTLKGKIKRFIKKIINIFISE